MTRLIGVAALAVALMGARSPGPASATEPPAAGDRLEVESESLELSFARSRPVALGWRACSPTCAAADRGDGTRGDFRVVARVTVSPAAARDDEPADGLTTVELSETPTARIVTFTSRPSDGVALVTAFEIPRRGWEVVISRRAVGPRADRFMAGRRFALELRSESIWSRPPAAGWQAIRDDVHRVTVGRWSGFRDRFWAFLEGSADTTADAASRTPLTLVLQSAEAAPSARHTVYSGPLEYRALGRTDPALDGLVFSGLWAWLRALSVAALFLLDALITVVGRPGPAIILLAAAIKLLLLPVTTVAHRLQHEVDEIRGRLAPQIDAIKADYTGEEQARRLLELHRRERVHPLYPLKSLLGVLIQLPVFIAVFDMLAENIALDHAPFLGIRDLARPDGLIPLPVHVPGLGSQLNLLPFAMSGVSLLAAARYEAAGLTPTLLLRQRRNLGALSSLFFVLFYAFPAGMVLYWTSTNALQLAMNEASRLRRRRRANGGP